MEEGRERETEIAKRKAYRAITIGERSGNSNIKQRRGARVGRIEDKEE